MTQRVRSEIHTRVSPQLMSLIDSEMELLKCTMSSIVIAALEIYFGENQKQKTNKDDSTANNQALVNAAVITTKLEVIDMVDDSEFFDFE